MHLFEQPGGQVWITEAPDWDQTGNSSVKVGMSPQSLGRRIERGQRASLGQLYGIICPGLIMTQHVFQGLKRPMLVSDDNAADQAKYAYSWAAKKDALLVGDRFNLSVDHGPAPLDRVFVVYISPNEMLDKFPAIWGWIEHWAWVVAAPDLPGAPVEWQTRYAEKKWSRAESR